MGWAEDEGYDGYDEDDFDEPSDFETTCRGCGRTIRMTPTNAGWRPYDKHGEEPHRCAQATAKDFPPV